MSQEVHPPGTDYFTTEEVAVMLGKHPASVRRWRSQNKLAGAIKYGPPYQFRGPNVVYPKAQFREWCARIEYVNGVPCMNMPTSATIPLPTPQTEAANEPARKVANA